MKYYKKPETFLQQCERWLSKDEFNTILVWAVFGRKRLKLMKIKLKLGMNYFGAFSSVNKLTRKEVIAELKELKNV